MNQDMTKQLVADAKKIARKVDSWISLSNAISDPQEGVNNVRSEVNRAIWRLFKEHGITIPVAQREIIVHNAAQ